MALIASDQKFTGRAGDFFQQTVASTGTVEYWSAKGLPEGLSINQNGVISGYPKSAGRFVSTVTAEMRATQVAAGTMHSLALLRDGTVMSWGRIAEMSQRKTEAREQGLLAAGGWDTYWMSSYVETPTGLSGIVAIAAGSSHALALKSDGTVVAWGDNAGGQCSVPSGLSNVVEISAGNSHSLARKADGTIVGWGIGLGKIPTPMDIAGMGLSGYRAVAIRAGDKASLALYENTQVSAGTIYSSSFKDSYGNPYSVCVSIGNGVVPYAVTGDAAASAFTAPGHNYTENQTVILTTFRGGNGLLWDSVYFVRNISGNTFQLSQFRGGEVIKFVRNMTAGSIIAIQANVPVSKSARFFDPSSGTIRIDDHGIRGIPRFVLSWGEDSEVAVKRTGGKVSDFQGNPIKNVSQLTIKITDKWSWHRGDENVFRVYDEALCAWRCFVHGGSEVEVWSVGGSSATALRRPAKGLVGGNTGLLTWGGGAGAAASAWEPRWSSYSTADEQAILNYKIRTGKSPDLGFSTSPFPDSPYYLQSLPEYYEVSYNARSEGDPRGSYVVVERRPSVRLMAAGDSWFFVLRGDGKMFAWGSAPRADVRMKFPKALNDTSLYRLSAAPTIRVPFDPLIQISVGYSHCLALVAEGWVVGWGKDTYDAINFPGEEIEFQIAGAVDISATATGAAGVQALLGETPKMLFSCEFICAVNTQAIFSNPTLKAEVYVSATLEGALAIRMGFAALASGVASATGVLGLVDLSRVLILVANIRTRRATTKISAGNFYSLALKNDGTVVGWGQNDYGQATSPAGLSGVIAVAAGRHHSLALKNDGTVVGWGYNYFSQTTIPAGLSGVIAVAAGHFHSLALKNDGTVVAWGDNNYGQAKIPAGLSGVIAVAAGGLYSLALKNDGKVVGWGRNDDGQTTIPRWISGVAIAAGPFHSLALKNDGTVDGWGDNTYGQATSPAGLSGVIAVAAGHSHSLALKNDGTVAAWGFNTYGQTTIPAGLSDVIAISSGYHYSLALKNDGTVVAWGSNGSGETTIPSELERGVFCTLEGVVVIGMEFVVSASGAASATGVLDFSPVPTLVASLQGVCALEGGVAIGMGFVAAASGVASTTGVLDFSPVSTLVANAQGVCALEGGVAIGMGFVAAASGVASATGVLDFAPVSTLVADAQAFSYVDISIGGARYIVLVQDLYASSMLEAAMVMTLNLARN
jgi:alpha-tubulin suppressor-like RCC1 family protein